MKKKKSNLKVEVSGSNTIKQENPIGYLSFNAIRMDFQVHEKISWFKKAAIRLFLGGIYRDFNNG